MENHEILYPDTEYAHLILRGGRGKELNIFSKDKDDEIEINMDDGYNNLITMFLNQEGIKLLVEHLQKQLI